MSDWKYKPPANPTDTKTVDGVEWTFCKHCKCRATNRKGFWTKHTTANHIFPRNATSEARTSDNVPEEPTNEPPTENPSVSLTAVEDNDEENISDSLAWEGIYIYVSYR